MTFNKEQFAKLLEKAKGNRSINKYASDANVSPAHISRLLRQLLDAPPSPEIISKLSQAAFNEVTYDNLMTAAGHIDVSEGEIMTSAKGSIIEKKFQQALIPYLFHLGNIKSINPPGNEISPFDLKVELSNGIYKSWYFICKTDLSNMNLSLLLGQLALCPFEDDDKITITVKSEKDYEFILKNKPLHLCINLFVMLIDLDFLEVIKEEVVCHV